MSEKLKVNGCPSCGGIDKCTKDCANPLPPTVPQDTVVGSPDSTKDCPSCTWVFISTVPGSQVILNGTKREDGLLEDTFMITFQPAGERKPHPIIIDALYTDFGVYATRDPKIASALKRAIDRGNAQYHLYSPDDPCLDGFDVKAYLDLPETSTCPESNCC
jgi:hypothetical protein